MQAAAKVLRRPLSAWLLLTLIGVLFFFPDAPLVMHQMALLLALVPMLRLLPDRVFEVLGRWPYFGTALYLLYRLSILLLDQPLYYRLYTLGIALVHGGHAGLVAAVVATPARARRDPAGARRDPCPRPGSRWPRCSWRRSPTSWATCRWPRC